MKLARPYRMAPTAIATLLAAKLVRDAAEPGSPSPVEAPRWRRPGSSTCACGPTRSPRSSTGSSPTRTPGVGSPRSRPRRVNVEFVSANPTGPLTIGNARGAFVGDLLARVLEAGGQAVTREYYFNDSGAQIRNLGRVGRGHPTRRAGPRGRLQGRLRRGPRRGRARRGLGSRDRRRRRCRRRSSGTGRPAGCAPAIEASLERLGVRFDVWTSEARLHDEGWVERAVERLRERGHVYEQDGATWFRSTDFGDDKDRVIYRADGRPTYFAADIGYVTEKFSRGFDHLIYIWGADHHGTVARVRNAAEAMGYDREAVQVLLYSWVRFVATASRSRCSKRAGEFITLDELLAEVGVDAARWFFASRADDERHRLRHRARQDADEREPGLLRPVRPRPDRVDPAQGGRRRPRPRRRRSPARSAPRTCPRPRLARAIVRLPEVVEDAVVAEETQGITAYATELATAFHAFYRDARVVDADAPERSAIRLALARAAQVTLAEHARAARDQRARVDVAGRDRTSPSPASWPALVSPPGRPRRPPTGASRRRCR